jgi:hypothetical protein
MVQRRFVGVDIVVVTPVQQKTRLSNLDQAGASASRFCVVFCCLFFDVRFARVCCKLVI